MFWKGSLELGPFFQILKKYSLRFVPLILALLVLARYLKPADFGTIMYKICLVLIAVALSEIIWMLFFKPFFGKTEKMEFHEKQPVLIFRGILYAAIILALTLGL